MDDLDEVLNESIMDSITGKRRAAEAQTKKKKRKRGDDDDDDDNDDIGYQVSSTHARMHRSIWPYLE